MATGKKVRKVKGLASHTRLLRDERGVSAIIVAICLLMLVGVTVLGIDIGYLMASYNELQNIADSAALAGAGELGMQHYYEAGLDSNAIRAAARDASGKSPAAGSYLEVTDADILIGTWNPKLCEPSPPEPECSFVPKSEPFVDEAEINAVYVIAKREGANPITTLFANVFGISSVAGQRDAVAALTPQSSIGPGELEIPVGISDYWFDYHVDFCDQPIKFYPTGGIEGCAGWTSYHASPPFYDHRNFNADKLGDIIDGYIEAVDPSTIDPLVPPGAEYNDDFDFGGGNAVANNFEGLRDLFDLKKEGPIIGSDGQPVKIFYDPDTFYMTVDYTYQGQDYTTRDGNDLPIILKDEDGNPLPQAELYEWETSVVVYQDDWSNPCQNPGPQEDVAGFADIVLNAVVQPGEEPNIKTIYAKVACNVFEPGRGGGGTSFGTFGTIPGLVE